ncbi:MAG: hypothetical protein CMG46_00655 [Candidatus Marinimicrobia bacterium]|nr:hypothetical protein [Candidatus Neomarinimicrobiota bacterium]
MDFVNYPGNTEYQGPLVRDQTGTGSPEQFSGAPLTTANPRSPAEFPQARCATSRSVGTGQVLGGE